MLRNRCHTPLGRALAATVVVWLVALPAAAGPYVTEASGVRWNDIGGVRWNDIGGVRWNDIGGVRWNDIGGLLVTDASGVRWNDIGGVRWNDIGGLEFVGPTGQASIDLELMEIVSFLPDSSTINVVVTYAGQPTETDLQQLVAVGVLGGTVFRALPMVAINATKQQIRQISELPGVRSVYSNKTLSLFDDASSALIGLDQVATDPELAGGSGSPTGAGVTIAVIDTGVDATHPDLPYGSKVVENVELNGALPTGPGFLEPTFVEGLPDTDQVYGHGTFVASVAAGTGVASGRLYRGVAPGAGVLALSAGELFIINVLEAFDYVLTRADELGVRVVNCSWGTQGWFDPDDPVNVATRLLYDTGINVVFAAGNHGPAPDTLNPYAVAPWVIGVGSTGKDGRLSTFSSRGVYEELLYHPTLVAPGEAIIAARAGLAGDVDGVSGVADASGGVSVPPQYASHYTVASGTSFAAPHVAGVVALMLELDPALTPGDVKRLLQVAATPELRHVRSAVGAGLLDAWAALTATVDPGRPFGSFVPGLLDERPFRVDHQMPVQLSATLAAGSTLSIPVSVPATAGAWSASLAWGTLPGANDLDVRVLDAGGAEVAASESINGLSLFGRAEGVTLLGDVPQQLTVEVSFKSGSGLADQPFHMRHEASVPVLTAFVDLGDLDAATVELWTAAVSSGLIAGRGDRLEATAHLTRGELARALALGAGAPQRIPGSPTFKDVSVGDAERPYVESVAGARAAHPVMQPFNANQFKPQGSVQRLDFAVALVRAAGLEAQAEARAGETLGLVDEDSIPAELSGFAAVAIERGLIGTVASADGERFKPTANVDRSEAARRLLALLSLRSAPSS